MIEILTSIGIDLVEIAIREQLPMIELDIEKPKIGGDRFLDHLLAHLSKEMNSVFLVGDDFTYCNTYN